MISGVGTDIIEIDRIAKACEKQAFLAHTFTQDEIDEAKGRASVLAGDYAVKEAVAKAFGTGFRGFSPLEIEALRDGSGKPYVVLYGGAKECADRLDIDTVYVSVSDTKDVAIAFAVAQTREGS